jgi:serine/threonine-protein kinase
MASSDPKPSKGTALAAGVRLGPYEILAAIPGGGMGQVYRGKDTRLGREIAIKILPEELAADPDRVRRFEQEAQAIAALKDARICTLLDVGEHDGRRFLVMEFVEGETLQDRLARGRLPLDHALRYGAEIAGALDVAHRRGIVHRDLKPGNVMVTKSGIKLLDFGLAKLRPAAVGAEAVTQSINASVEGTLIGTLPYMAPEQVQGRDTDARTDIWALGCVLYEMIAGRRPFDGSMQAALIAAILEREPASLAGTPTNAPAEVDRLVRTCLAKEPDERWQSAADVARQLRGIVDRHDETTAASSETTARLVRNRVLWANIGLGVGITLGALIWWAVGAPSPVLSITGPRPYSIDLTPAETLGGGLFSNQQRQARAAIELSPDGRVLVFVGRRAGVQDQQLFVRALNNAEPARPLEGTERAQMPFFSPNGLWIAFWRGKADGSGEILKIPIGGGTPVRVCSTSRFIGGASWGDDDSIVFGENGLKTVPAAGGTPSVLTTLNSDTGENGHFFPRALPAAQGWLYTIVHGPFFADVSVWVLPAETKRPQLVVPDAADARYLPTGHIVFAQAGKLMAARFDLGGLRVNGGAVGVLDSVLQALNGPVNANRTGAAQYSVSNTGDLVYVTGGIDADPTRSLMWIDLATGKAEALAVEKKAYGAPRLSPNERRIAVTTGGTVPGLWVADLERPGVLTRAPFNGRASFALWTPDGQKVVFTGHGRDVRPGLYAVPADGSAPAVLLAATVGPGPVAASWTPHGDLIFVSASPTVQWDDTDIMLYHLKNDRVSELIATDAEELDPALSPDGQWLAYTSRTLSSEDVFVVPYPALTPRTQVSLDGGRAPRWLPGSKGLLYRNQEKTIVRVMRVDITHTPGLRPSLPYQVWEGPAARLGQGHPVAGFDLTRDGRRLLGYSGENATPPAPTVINVVVNWFDELRTKMNAGR